MYSHQIVWCVRGLITYEAVMFGEHKREGKGGCRFCTNGTCLQSVLDFQTKSFRSAWIIWGLVQPLIAQNVPGNPIQIFRPRLWRIDYQSQRNRSIARSFIFCCWCPLSLVYVLFCWPEDHPFIIYCWQSQFQNVSSTAMCYSTAHNIFLVPLPSRTTA